MAKSKQEKALNTENAVTLDEKTAIKETTSNEELLNLISKEIKPKKKAVDIISAERYDTSPDFGLNKEQIESRILDGLNNASTNKTSKSYLSIICSNTFSFFNLLCALVFTLYCIVGTTLSDFAFIIPFAVNLFIGIFQEIRAKISVEKLSLLQSPMTKVIRCGIETEINSKDILLDEIIKLGIGKQIPVDAIVISGTVDVNESLITGESVAVKKQEGDFLYAGSFITSGICLARADKVGKECYVQKLTAKAKKFKKPQSELMSTLRLIIRIVGILIVPISIGVGLVNFHQAEVVSYIESIKQFVVTHTGSVILGMIPAGLMLLTTMALALGVIRLAKTNTLVQDMYSLEMLARTDVLCLDKTGTITDGRMNVADVIKVGDSRYSVNDIIGNIESCLEDNNQTSIALRDYFKAENQFLAINTIPFSSVRKYSAVSFDEIGTFILGAPEFIMSEIPERLQKRIEQYTKSSHRVLLLAYSPNIIQTKDTLPSSIKPIYLIALSDNIREEAIQTINWFKENDVEVKVISGDNPLTVSEIAKRAGIENASNWVSLEGLSDKEVATVANKYTVFGRVTPEQKCVLVKAIKRAGHTVSMTGDGVNDILAMKEADCSITVASGSDATKNIAHIVLADNNFNSMPKVVTEGRRVINNIQQSASLYLMKTIFITVLALISIATMTEFPFRSGMLMMLETIIIGFGSLSLSLQPNNKRVEGDFLVTIFSNAIPGALILLFNVYAVKIFDLFNMLPKDDLTLLTYQVVAFTLGGAVYLFNLCKPFNLFRGFLVATITLVMVVWVVWLLDTSIYFHIDNFFGLINIFPLDETNWQYPLLLLSLIQLDFPILSGMFKFGKYLSASIKKKKQ